MDNTAGHTSTTRRRLLGAVGMMGIGGVALAGCQKKSAAARHAAASPMMGVHADVMQAVRDWPQKHQEAAQKMADKYGPPHGMTKDRLIWEGSGPWKTTILYREEWEHNFPAPHKDFLEQVTLLRVPPEMFDDLAQYDGSVFVHRTPGTIAAMCDMEEFNFLAADIVQGRRSVQDARMFYTHRWQRRSRSRSKSIRTSSA